METISGHTFKRTNMAAKGEMFMNCSKNFIGIVIKHILLLNKEHLRDHRGGGTNIVYKHIFENVNLTYHGHYTHMCTVSKGIGINTENKIFLSNH